MRHVDQDGWRAADGSWRPGKPPQGWERSPDGRWLAPLMPPTPGTTGDGAPPGAAMVTLVSPLRPPRQPPTRAHELALEVADPPLDAASLFDWDTLRPAEPDAPTPTEPKAGTPPHPAGDGRVDGVTHGPVGGTSAHLDRRPHARAGADPQRSQAPPPPARPPLVIGPDGPEGPMPSIAVAPTALPRVAPGGPVHVPIAPPGPAGADRAGDGDRPEAPAPAPAGSHARTGTPAAAAAGGPGAEAGDDAERGGGAVVVLAGGPAPPPPTTSTSVFADPDGWDARFRDGDGEGADYGEDDDDYDDYDDDHYGGAHLAAVSDGPGTRRRRLAALVASVLVVVAVAGLVVLSGGDGEPETATPGSTTTTDGAPATSATTVPTTPATAPPTTAPTTAAPTTAPPTTAPSTTAPTTTAPPTTAAPTTTVAPTTTSERDRDRGRDPHYDNCWEVVADGAAPLYRGEPGYDESLDWDGDGVACEIPW